MNNIMVKRQHTVEDYIARNISLTLENYCTLSAPFTSYDLQRIEALNHMFFVGGSGFEWVKDSEGLLRRVSKQSFKTPKKSSKDLYGDLVSASKADYQKPIPYQIIMDRCAKMGIHPILFGMPKHFTIENGAVYNTKPSIFLFWVWDLSRYMHKGFRYEVDFTQIHPDSKAGLLELVNYCLSSENLIYHPLDAASERKQECFDFLKAIQLFYGLKQ